MQPDTINAIGMITMAAFTAIAVLMFRTKPIREVSWKTKIPAALGGCLISLIVILMQVPRCVELPEPFGQFKLTALCVSMVIIFVRKKHVIRICVSIVLLAGASLEKQFINIVHFLPGFTTIDANSHRPMAKGCNDMKSPDGIVAEKLWHTWFTGIYEMSN